MTTSPEVVRQSDLRHQLVLDRTTMEELGRVEVMWMYPSAHRVLGFVCKAGAFGAQKTAFKLAQISTLGLNGILTQNQPEATDAVKVRQLESLLHCEVWSDTGSKIGKIVDYQFNLKTGNITHYLLASSGWAGIAGDLYQFPPTQVLSIGRKRILVTETAAQTFAVYQSGIKQTLSKAKSVLQEDYGQATTELRSLSKQAQGRLQTLTGQFKERARSLSKQAQEEIQTLNEQLQEDAQTLAEQAKETSQVFAERMKERTQTFGEQLEDGIQILGEQVEDGIQTLTVQAKEILDPPVSSSALNSHASDLNVSDLNALDLDTAGDDATQPNHVDGFAQATEPTHPSPPHSSATSWDDDDDEPWITDAIEPLSAHFIPQQTQHTATQPGSVTASEADPDDDDEPWI